MRAGGALVPTHHRITERNGELLQKRDPDQEGLQVLVKLVENFVQQVIPDVTLILDPGRIRRKMSVLRSLGHPYTDEEIARAPGQLEGKTEMDAMIAYLQGLGTAIKTRR